MSHWCLQLVIGMLITDEEFRREFERGGAEYLERLRRRGIELNEIERAALVHADRRLWSRIAMLIGRSVTDIDWHSSDRPEPMLTPQETDILRRVAEGLTNKQIAADEGLSEAAVKATLQRLFRKTHVRSRVQLVRVAHSYPTVLSQE